MLIIWGLNADKKQYNSLKGVLIDFAESCFKGVRIKPGGSRRRSAGNLFQRTMDMGENKYL